MNLQLRITVFLVGGTALLSALLGIFAGAEFFVIFIRSIVFALVAGLLYRGIVVLYHRFLSIPGGSAQEKAETRSEEGSYGDSPSGISEYQVEDPPDNKAIGGNVNLVSDSIQDYQDTLDFLGSLQDNSQATGATLSSSGQLEARSGKPEYAIPSFDSSNEELDILPPANAGDIGAITKPFVRKSQHRISTEEDILNSKANNPKVMAQAVRTLMRRDKGGS